MHRFFGKSNKQTTSENQPSLHESINNMGSRADHLQSKIEKCNKDLLQYKQQMKQSRSPMLQNQIKSRMVQVLKQKKLYQQQLDMLKNQQFNMETTQFQIETMKDTTHTFQAVKSAHNLMKKEMSYLSIDDVEDLQDEMEDLFHDTQEIQQAMSRSYTVPDCDIDDCELDAELDALSDYDDQSSSVSDSLPSYLSSFDTFSSSTNTTKSNALGDYSLPTVPSSQLVQQNNPTLSNPIPSSDFSLGF